MRYFFTVMFLTAASFLAAQEATELPLTLYAPNCFTPDLDGVNDVWKVVSDEEWDAINIAIYNEWGEIVWQSSTLDNCWQGNTNNGSYYSPDGQYFYVVEARKGQFTERKRGAITMIR